MRVLRYKYTFIEDPAEDEVAMGDEQKSGEPPISLGDQDILPDKPNAIALPIARRWMRRSSPRRCIQETLGIPLFGLGSGENERNRIVSHNLYVWFQAMTSQNSETEVETMEMERGQGGVMRSDSEKWKVFSSP